MSIRKLLFVFTLLLMVCISLTTPILAIPVQNSVSKQHYKINSSESIPSVVSVEKRVNTTLVYLNEPTIVEIIITNTGSHPVYKVKLTEDKVINPLINVSHLISPIEFPQLLAHEKITLAYTISSQKPVNFTLSQSEVTYQSSEAAGAIVYTSFSSTINLRFIEKSQNLAVIDKQNYLIYSIIIVFYIVILSLRIVIKKRSSESSVT